MGMPDHLTWLLRNLYAGQEAAGRTRHVTMDWFKIGKGVHQGYILSSCLFNLCVEYIMQIAGVDDSQPGVKIAGRNINNLRYADYTTLITKCGEELKSLLMRVKEESENAALILTIQKTKIMPSFHSKEMGKSGNSDNFISLGSKIPADSDCSHEI